MLVNVIMFEALKGCHRLLQAGGCHAPCANRGSHQVNSVLAVGQPFAKQKPVHRSQDQALGPTCRPRHHRDILRRQALRLQVLQGDWTRLNVQGSHGLLFQALQLGESRGHRRLALP